MLRFDLTITVGDILLALSLCGTLTVLAWRVLRKWDKLISIMREYPPHRHAEDGQIFYPADYPEPAVGHLGKKASA